jgi:hypothetical protein
MHPSNIVRLGVTCIALLVGACGFSPGRPANSGTAASGASSGTGNVTGIGNFGGASSGQGGLTGNGGGQQCGAVPKSSSKLPPDILIVQDASGSMNEDATNTSCGNMGCGATSKWALMIPAINMVVSETQTEVNWGLKLFADQGACGVNNNAAVPIAPMNAAPIAAALMARTSANGGVSNGSSTPTRAAEAGAVNYLMGVQDQNPKFIVMATDGQPNCPASGSQQTDDTPAAVAAVTTARMAGFSTFVVGVSAPAGAANDALNMMAVEGGYPQMGAATQYYAVTDTAGFASVLRTLVGQASTCNFSIPTPPTTDGTTSREDITVTGSTGTPPDMTIPQDANNGWTYSDTTHTSITLHGTACDQVTAGTITTVTIIFNCHII